MTPLSVLATAAIEMEHAGSASAMFNLMRNLGGAIGIAILQTEFTWREQYHSNVMSGAISLASNATQQTIAKLTGYFMAHGLSDTATAQHEAMIAIGRFVKMQASIMGYADTFFVLGTALVLALIAALCLSKVTHFSAGGAH